MWQVASEKIKSKMQTATEVGPGAAQRAAKGPAVTMTQSSMLVLGCDHDPIQHISLGHTICMTICCASHRALCKLLLHFIPATLSCELLPLYFS